VKKLMLGLAALVLVLVAYFAFAPAPIDAAAWNAPVAPAMKGPLAPGEQLKSATLLAQGQITGPEDISVDGQGRIVTGVSDGRILRLEADGALTELGRTGGHPLGLKFDAQGSLWICDAWKGLLKLAFDAEGKPLPLQTVLTEVDGAKLNFTDDLDIAADGKIYFTDASSKFTQPDHVLDALEGRPHGRLMVFDPASNEARTLLKDLYFANGVAVSKSQDSVYVSETYRFRITRLWLRGPKAGKHEVWLDNLPGYPDNINTDGAGMLWVAYPSPRKPEIDKMSVQPAVRTLISKLPRALLPKATPMGFVAAYDEPKGTLKHALFDKDGTHLRMITSALPHAGHLYMGSLDNDRIGKIALPK
jgi:sugar lactone lactonase YvrE